jgi:hypothetical protein
MFPLHTPGPSSASLHRLNCHCQLVQCYRAGMGRHGSYLQIICNRMVTGTNSEQVSMQTDFDLKVYDGKLVQNFTFLHIIHLALSNGLN